MCLFIEPFSTVKLLRKPRRWLELMISRKRNLFWVFVFVSSSWVVWVLTVEQYTVLYVAVGKFCCWWKSTWVMKVKNNDRIITSRWVRGLSGLPPSRTLWIRSLSPSTCWKERIYSWKLSLNHHMCSVARHGHSSERNKKYVFLRSKKYDTWEFEYGGEPCNPSTQGLEGNSLRPAWATREEKKKKGKKGKEKGREKRKGKGSRGENVHSFLTVHPVSFCLLVRSLHSCWPVSSPEWWPALSCHTACAGEMASALWAQWDPTKLLVLALWHQGTVFHNVLELCLNYSKRACL